MKRIFKNESNELYSIWKIIRLMLLIIIVTLVIHLGIYLTLDFNNDTLSKNITFFSMIFSVIFSIKIIEKRKLKSVGLTIRKKDIKNFILGIVLSILLYTLLFIGVSLLKGNLDIDMLIKALVSSKDTIFYWGVVGFSEELLFRGYLLNNTFLKLNFWWKNIIFAVVFSLIHIFNPTYSLLFMFIIPILFGIYFGYMIHITGSIWMGVGFHIIWNYFHNANMVMNHGMIEEDLMLMPIIIIVGLLFTWVLKKKKVINDTI